MTEADPELDKVMKAYASDAIASAARREIVLDYSEESLEGVDELLSRESFIGRTPRKPSSDEERERLWICSKMFGGYVGEVTLRTLGGYWFAYPLENGEVRIAIEAMGIKGFPISKVWKRLTESEFDTVSGYCRAIRAIAAPKT